MANLPSSCCVECGHPQDILLQCGETTVVRRCVLCGALTDRYQELDFILASIDVVLAKAAAYRHALLNSQLTNRNLIKLISILVLADAYIHYIRHPWLSSVGVSNLFIDPLVGLLVYKSLAELVGFVAGVVVGVRLCCRPSAWRDFRLLAMTVVVSSVAKSYVILAAIWTYPLFFTVLVEGWVLVSNVVAFSAILRCRPIVAVFVVLCGIILRSIVTVILPF